MYKSIDSSYSSNIGVEAAKSLKAFLKSSKCSLLTEQPPAEACPPAVNKYLSKLLKASTTLNPLGARHEPL